MTEGTSIERGHLTKFAWAVHQLAQGKTLYTYLQRFGSIHQREGGRKNGLLDEQNAFKLAEKERFGRKTARKKPQGRFKN